LTAVRLNTRIDPTVSTSANSATTPRLSSAIEVELQRFYGHHSGDAQLYRAKDEGKMARESADPLAMFRRRVTESGVLQDATFAEIDVEVAARIDGAVAGAKAAAPPKAEVLLQDVYISY